MKKLIKRLSFVLVICLFAQTAVFADDTVTEEQLLTNDEITVLTSLGITDEEDLANDEKVTKTVFLNYLLKMIGKADETGGAIPYTDILPGTDEFKTVSTAYSLGFLTQTSGKFQPSAVVDAEFIFDTVANATTIKKAYNNKLSKLNSVRKEIFSGAGNPNENGYSKSQILKIVYNVLGIDIFEEKVLNDNYFEYEEQEGKSLISVYRDIYKVNGRVLANAYGAVSGNQLSGDMVNIDGYLYDCSPLLAYDMLGRQVEAYALISNTVQSEIICMIADNENSDTLRVWADDIVSFSGNTLKYLNENEKVKSKTISSKTSVIYNGKPVTGNDYSESLFAIKEGYIDIVDSDFANSDTVLIYECDNILVNSVDIDNEAIYDKARKNNNLKLKDKDYIITTVDGVQLELEKITPNTVITYYKSLDDSLVRIIQANGSKSGVLSEIRKRGNVIETIVVDNNEYALANSVALSDLELVLGNEYNYYSDAYGKIGAVTTRADIDGTLVYVLDVDKSSGLGSKVQAKVYTPDGNEVIYDFAESVTIDGMNGLKGDNILKAMKNNQVTFERIPMIFKTNSKGEIKVVDTPYSPTDRNGSYYESDVRLRKVISINDGVQYIKTSAGYAFKNNIGGKIVVKNTATVIAEYSDGDVSILKSLPNDKSLPLDVYAMGENSPVCEFVVLKNPASLSYSMLDKIFIYKEKRLVLDKITEEVEPRVTLINAGKEVVYTFAEGKESLLDSLNTGDIIRIAEDAFGDIVDMKLFYDYKEKKLATGITNPTSSFNLNQAFRVALGKVYSVKDNCFSFYYPVSGLESVTEAERLALIKPKLEANFINDGSLYMYKVERDKIVYEKINPNEILTYETANLDSDTVLLRTNYGTPTEMIIIK